MITELYKKIGDFASGVGSDVAKFKKVHPDEKVFAAGFMKQCSMPINKDALDLRNWRNVKQGTGILTQDKIIFNSSSYDLGKASDLEIVKFYNLFGCGQIVKYLKDGVYTCFSMQYDSHWSGQLFFSGKEKIGKLKGWGGLVFIFLSLIILWTVISKLF